MKATFLNPFAYFRFARRLFRRLNDPPPLNDYPDYDEYWAQRHLRGKNPPLLHRYKAIAELLPQGASVLDVGCGDGTFGAHIQSTRPDCTYFGLDISSTAIRLAQTRGLQAAVLDPTKRLRDQVERRFDVVTAMEVIEHVHDAEDLMRDITELSSELVIVTIPNSGYILHRMRLALFGRFPVTTIVFHMKEHIRFWTYRDFRDWIPLFGLQINKFIGQETLGGGAAENLLARHAPSLFASQVIYVMAKIRGATSKGLA